jgi:hypothetical protein
MNSTISLPLAEAIHGDPWILFNAFRVVVDGIDKAVEVVFVRDTLNDSRIWAFPSMGNFDVAFRDLQSHVGKVVTGLVVQPNFLCIAFQDGSEWRVSTSWKPLGETK